MRKSILFAFAGMALLAASCQKSETEVTTGLGSEGVTRIIATIGQPAKAAVTDEGKFTWEEGDAITAYFKTKDMSAMGGAASRIEERTFTLEEGAGTQTGTFASSGGISDVLTADYKYAAYSCALTHDANFEIDKVTIPSTYTWAESNAIPTPMINFETGEGDRDNVVTTSFRHIAGLVKFTFKLPQSTYEGNPTYYDGFDFKINATDVITLSGRERYPKISGELSFDSVNFKLNAGMSTGTGTTTEVTDLVWKGPYIQAGIGTGIQKYYAATVYIPLPVSTYEGFKLTLTDSSGNEREKTVTNGGQGYTVEAGMLAIFQNLNVMDFE